MNTAAPDAGLLKGNTDPAYRKALSAEGTNFDGTKAPRVLGFSYRDRDATLAETAALVRKQLGLEKA